MGPSLAGRLALPGILATMAACGPLEPIAIPRNYVAGIVDLMEQHSINRNSIDWSTFRSQVMAEAEGARTVVDAYPAIHLALQLLGDGHSFYAGADGTMLNAPDRTCTAPLAPYPGDPGNPAVDSDIGYVRVSGFSGSAAQAQALVDGYHRTLSMRDKAGLAGWIVDLRGNLGGNMWPMLAGIGPILGDGTAGFFVSPDSTRRTFDYVNGGARLDGVIAIAADSVYHLIHPGPRVAVLVDGRTVSSGEAIAIAFKQRPNTRFFGTGTCGLSTANEGFALADGATLLLTTATMADRAGGLYGDTVRVDESVSDVDSVIPRASTWLRGATALARP